MKMCRRYVKVVPLPNGDVDHIRFVTIVFVEGDWYEEGMTFHIYDPSNFFAANGNMFGGIGYVQDPRWEEQLLKDGYVEIDLPEALLIHSRCEALFNAIKGTNAVE